PWGIALSSTSPFWVANQRSGISTLYAGDVKGNPLVKNPLEVTIPPAPGRSQGSPTGIVFNGSPAFVLTGRPARTNSASIDGVISAWNSGTRAELVAMTPGAVYTGLAIGNNGSANFLYAANVAAGRIDVFDTDFNRVTLAGSFSDPNLSTGGTSFSPFN